MLKIPDKLLPYVDFEEGKIIAVNLPDELKEDFEALKKVYKTMKEDKLSEY